MSSTTVDTPATETGPLGALLARVEELYLDLDLKEVQRWKEEVPGRKAIGYLPVYVPREVVHACGALPVGIMGGGDQLEIIRGDAYFQSYLCHLPRSLIELGLTGRLDCLDGMLFPSICDVIRNLSGMWKMLFADKMARYVDLPQNFDPEVGGQFYQHELRALMADVAGLTGKTPSDDDLNMAIAAYNHNRDLHNQLYDLRRQEPWKVPTAELYLMVRAGNVLPVDEHSCLLEEYKSLVTQADRRPMDQARVVVVGSFCEQPPLDLIRTLERAGCYLVGDDYVLGSRWIRGKVPTDGDPIQSLAESYLSQSVAHTAVYIDQEVKGAALIEEVERTGAEGVLFAAPSFCDPALLDQPMLQNALDAKGIPYTAFKYSENTGQFQVIREQAGTFADSIKLWSHP